MKKILLLFIGIFFYIDLFPQLTVNTSMTPTQLAQNIFLGSGVTVSNVTYNGIPQSIGHFTTGVNTTNLGLSEGIILSTGLVDGSNGQFPIGSLSNNFNSWLTNSGSDQEIQYLIPDDTVYDAAILEFSFIPITDTIKFQYVFASEEYPVRVNSSYNDVIGFFLTGPKPEGGNYTNQNIALIPDTTLPVTINNINNVLPSYPQYYIDNTNGTAIVYNGFTTVLSAYCHFIPYVTYHIKLAIGDAGDEFYDSAVFLNAHSLNAGIENYSYADSIFLFPNPATDNLQIRTPKKSQIEILNINGKIIKTIIHDSGEFTIDTEDLSSGVYLIKVTTDKGIMTKNFIKK